LVRAKVRPSLTLLPDGRAIQIGGEHEDYYDPDFCIYNDVFVHEPDRSIDRSIDTDLRLSRICLSANRFSHSHVDWRLHLCNRLARLPWLSRVSCHPGTSLRHPHFADGAAANLRRSAWLDLPTPSIGCRCKTHSNLGRPPREINSGDAEVHNPNSEAFQLDLDQLVWQHIESFNGST
jgi:hypothetical protein